ncbi:iron-dicitrate transporter substrate-binding subunit [compost metagenome]
MKLGEIVGKTQEAEAALQQYDASAADLKAKITAKFGKESVMYMMLSEKMIRAQGGTRHALNDLLYKELGLTIPAGIPADKDRVDLSLEGLSAFEPDNILLVEYQNVDAVKSSSVWKDLKAVADNKVFTADGFWMSMSWGPQGRTLVLQQLADVIKA